MSFSEWRHRKSSLLVDLSGDTPQVAHVDAPVQRPLAVLRGTLDELLADPAHHGAEAAWCQVTLTDPQRPLGAMDQVRRRFRFAALEACASTRRRHGAAAAVRRPRRDRDRRRGVERIPFSTTCAAGGLPADDERALLAEAVEAEPGVAQTRSATTRVVATGSVGAA